MKIKLLLFFILTLPSYVFGQPCAPSSAQGQGISFTICNPLSANGITDIQGLIVAILTVAITLATPIVVLFIIYAGFLYVTARGNSAQIEQATRAFTYAIIGGVLIIGAVAISQVVGNVVNSFAT